MWHSLHRDPRHLTFRLHHNMRIPVFQGGGLLTFIDSSGKYIHQPRSVMHDYKQKKIRQFVETLAHKLNSTNLWLTIKTIDSIKDTKVIFLNDSTSLPPRQKFGSAGILPLQCYAGILIPGRIG